ncbi:MAG: bifunctional 5,10-methylenetetrahydrofolate dehydrogenase/5,10-methenyltetrahydrofolate cyclohydrolase [Patescibacteria group bacterium]
MAHILSGTRIGNKILTDLREEVRALSVVPRIAAILVGDNPASRLYVRMKEQRCSRVGIAFEKIVVAENTNTQSLCEIIRSLNARMDVHAILVQLPLPAGLDTDIVIRSIDPRKDVDGFHPDNIERFMHDTQPYVEPVLIHAIRALLEATGNPLTDKQAVILGKSDVFMRPLGASLTRMGLHVQWITQSTDSWKEICATADVLVTALGVPHSVTADAVKQGASIIDVGISKLDGQVAGDVHPDAAARAGFITPVPGGVGPMTVAMLLHTVVHLARTQTTTV